MGGANVGTSYIPHTTSYDVDALISESGIPTVKYYLCRDVLDEYLGKEKRAYRHTTSERQSFSVILSECADLFENLDILSESKDFSIIPRPMEDYGQNYGLILYSTSLDAFQEVSVEICPYEYRDRANIYIDNEWFATFLRDRGLTKTAGGIQTTSDLPTLTPNGRPRKIDILVENIGRINYGKALTHERKGLEEAILSSHAKLFGYQTFTLPLKDLKHLTWEEKKHKDHLPCFFKGVFNAKQGIDTYVDFSNFGHGYIWINGFNLGRYDSAGPQMTLYIPGEILKVMNNEIIILDIDPVGDKRYIKFIDHEILEGDASELS